MKRIFMLFRVLVFLDQIHHILGQAPVGFDHVGDEGEDEELEADQEGDAGEEEVIAVRRDFEILEVEEEETDENDESDEHEDEPGSPEELHRAYVADSPDDDAHAVVDVAPDGFHDAGFASLEISDLYRQPDDLQVFAEGIDDDFLGIGESARQIEPQERLLAVGAETARQVLDIDVHEAPDEFRSQAVQEVLQEGDVFRLQVIETVSAHHVGLVLEDRHHQLLDVFRVELAVGVNIHHHVGAIREGSLGGMPEGLADTAIDAIRVHEIRSGSLGDFDSAVFRTVIDDLDEYFAETVYLARNALDGAGDLFFFVECREVDYETHKSKSENY